MSKSARLYLVAGEASGDARGAELMRALTTLAPSTRFEGAGGPQMKELATGSFLDWADEAVVGLWDVLKKYGYFRHQFARILDEIRANPPEALVLIDYPGFNLRLARAVRKTLPKLTIIFYISPQVWAWHRSRIPAMARTLDLMLCIFPFEKELYEQSGLKTEFVGHPLLDSLAAKRTPVARNEALVALLPGSRGKEVRRIFPTMIAAAQVMHKARSDLRFEAAAASETLAEEMRASVHGQGGSEEFCRVQVGSAHQLMQRAAVGMVCSGTATLEAAYFGLPMVILYQVAWLTYVIGKRLVQVDFLGMPNLLAGREIVREFIQEEAVPSAIGAEMLRILNDTSAREKMRTDLASVIEMLGEPGAGQRAATAIVQELKLSTE